MGQGFGSRVLGFGYLPDIMNARGACMWGTVSGLGFRGFRGVKWRLGLGLRYSCKV